MRWVAGSWHSRRRVIRPSLDAFRGHTYPNYDLDFGLVAKDPLLDRFHATVEASDAPPAARRTALFDVACASGL
ncbi:hypothetical protein [Streptomyces sp. NPDC057939]|uniref:hypothetical protein n=1 Tax=Streptomyces sp. NPDC057939 TaxID=3346284 RepID=UPI0036E152D5